MRFGVCQIKIMEEKMGKIVGGYLGKSHDEDYMISVKSLSLPSTIIKHRK